MKRLSVASWFVILQLLVFLTESNSAHNVVSSSVEVGFPSIILAIPGQKDVVVPIIISDAKNLSGGDFIIKYDADLLRITQISKTELTKEFMMVSNQKIGKAAILLVAASNANMPSGYGAICEILFEVNPNINFGRSCELSFQNVTLYNQDAVPIPINISNGRFMVMKKVIGDLNFDSKVDSGDAIIALQMAKGVIPASPILQHVGDMNEDGKITVDDSELILQKAMELSLEETKSNEYKQIVRDTVSQVPAPSRIEESQPIETSDKTINNEEEIVGSNFDRNGKVPMENPLTINNPIDSLSIRLDQTWIEVGSELDLLDVTENIPLPDNVSTSGISETPDESIPLEEETWMVVGETLSEDELELVESNPPVDIDEPKVDSWLFEPNSSWVGTGGETTVSNENGSSKAMVILMPNFPNPFNSETWIPFRLSVAANVNIRIYNIFGQLIRTLELGHKEPDYYKVHWDGRNRAGERVASGIYFYVLQAGSFSTTRRLMIRK